PEFVGREEAGVRPVQAEPVLVAGGDVAGEVGDHEDVVLFEDDPVFEHDQWIVRMCGMSRPILALVGRPNTGKSTLFNRLVGWRKAIVDREPGLTRDRLYGVTDWRGRELTVVDTAGLLLSEGLGDSSRAGMEAQTRIAVEEAQVIVLMLDVREGLTPIDRDIAEMLRGSSVPVIVAANKADDPRQQYFRHELLELGFPEVVPISGQHGIGIDDLMDEVLAVLPPPEEGGGKEEEEEEAT